MKFRKIIFGCLLIASMFRGAAIADPGESASAQPLRSIRVAVTIDDLPIGSGIFSSSKERNKAVRQIIEILKENGLSDAYGFSNGSFMEHDPGAKQILQMWLRAKHPLGNHTFHHLDLGTTSATDFIDDIAKQDQLLATLDHSANSVQRRRVFRYPFLSEGNTLEKREAVRKYLFENHYTIAEVTTDYFDWAWGAAFARCQSQHDEKSIAWLKSHITESADAELRATSVTSQRLLHQSLTQILLVHLNAFTAMTLGEILRHWRAEGVQFVSLDEALAEPIYRFDSKSVSNEGRTFLEQIAELLGGSVQSAHDTFYTPPSLNEVCKDVPPPHK
jgi:peptidoglycan/xylan/chitin deacetylase (PgdA/CDA1 family)